MLRHRRQQLEDVVLTGQTVNLESATVTAMNTVAAVHEIKGMDLVLNMEFEDEEGEIA